MLTGEEYTVNKVIKKIAIVGPESTGKSTLSWQLAQHYGVAWVPEYARYYCAALTAPCTLQDEVNMFHGQLALEDSILATTTADFIICDTTFLTVKIWSDEMLGKTPQIVLDTLITRPYDFYVLLDIDLPWEEDPLRDFPHQREHFMKIWHEELQVLNADYVVVGGLHDRLPNAIKVIDSFLNR
ncbi:nicotinamide-nucleotide adenylyltransferase [compost metagenome]